jgi:hypothetical protein
MKRLVMTVAILAGASCAAFAQTVPDEAVMLVPIVDGGKAIFSGASVGQIVGLKKGGDGFVSVRGAPTLKGQERGRLTLNRYVLMLSGNTAAEKAGFIGVIYIERAKDADVDLEQACGIENPIPPTMTAKRIYRGPCKSGWIARRFVKVLAD